MERTDHHNHHGCGAGAAGRRGFSPRACSLAPNPGSAQKTLAGTCEVTTKAASGPGWVILASTQKNAWQKLLPGMQTESLSGNLPLAAQQHDRQPAADGQESRGGRLRNGGDSRVRKTFESGGDRSRGADISNERKRTG